ncbi:hypothetical protein H0H92_002793 [Tricholoma furcatifolium]|nr:hypothetical protein H0H92_002793 [Tricholoma furcatifolium]
MPQTRQFRPKIIPCRVSTCTRKFSSQSGATQHYNTKHAPSLSFIQQNQLQNQTPDPPTPPSSPPIFPEDPIETGLRTNYHPFINGLPCDEDGHFLPEGAPPPPFIDPSSNDFSPYEDRFQFELADILFRRTEMAATPLNDLMQVWGARHSETGPPFNSKQHLHDIIDSTEIGGVSWQSFIGRYSGEIRETDIESAPWKLKDYDVWFRDPLLVLRSQLGNSDFKGEMDVAAKRVYDTNGKRRYGDVMSGEWAHRQSDLLAENPDLHGATFCPIILGSDKTTVSVATGHTEYYPLYMSNGLIHNNVRRAHRNGLTLIAFLSIPKMDAEHRSSDEFRHFRRHLFHQSLRYIFETLRPYMTSPDIVRFADGYFRRVIYGFGPYIADYPEQVLLTCVVQGWCARCTAHFNDLDGPDGGRRTHELTEALTDLLGKKALWDDYGIVSDIQPFTYSFPRADIHELIAPDLLHQLIKGTFKDHLVTWIIDYIEATHTPNEAAKIIADIDRRIAAVPPFPGLRRFPEGRGFKQWTGDDSKALMKVYLPAISGHVPAQMVKAVKYFLEFCYLVRRSVIDEDDLVAIDDAVSKFHEARLVFQELGVRPDGISLPRQHSIIHYRRLIQEFGVPNGLCSSITESAHIRAVKRPWRRSSRYKALGQMLLVNQRLDKLAASRVDFTRRGMLTASLFSNEHDAPRVPLAANDDDDDDGGAVEGRNIWGEVLLARKPFTSIPFDAEGLGAYYAIPSFANLISRFLYEQAHPDLNTPLIDVPLEDCPPPSGRIRVYPSAVATFYAPSNISGVGGMFRERIRAVPSWRGGPARNDCVFVEQDKDLPGFRGLHAARVRMFFELTMENKRKFPCALVTWFHTIMDEPCPETGMWIVEKDRDSDENLIMSVIHIDTILRGAHLIGRAHSSYVPRTLDPGDSLDAFEQFYINKYIDHHSHEIAF